MCEGWNEDNVEELAEFRVDAEKCVRTVVDGEGVNDADGITLARTDGVGLLEETSAVADICDGSLCACARTCKIQSSRRIRRRIYISQTKKNGRKRKETGVKIGDDLSLSFNE